MMMMVMKGVEEEWGWGIITCIGRRCGFEMYEIGPWTGDLAGCQMRRVEGMVEKSAASGQEGT